MALDNLRNLPHEIMVDLDYLNAYQKKSLIFAFYGTIFKRRLSKGMLQIKWNNNNNYNS